MYSAVMGSFNTVSVPSVTVVESLVQVTVVAGPPVDIQVRVNLGLAPLRSEYTVIIISRSFMVNPVKSKHRAFFSFSVASAKGECKYF